MAEISAGHGLKALAMRLAKELGIVTSKGKHKSSPQTTKSRKRDTRCREGEETESDLEPASPTQCEAELQSASSPGQTDRIGSNTTAHHSNSAQTVSFPAAAMNGNSMLGGLELR